MYGNQNFTPAISWSMTERVFRRREHGAESDEPVNVVLEPPLRFALDNGSVKHGPLRYDPFVKLTVPLRELPPPLPPDLNGESKPAYKTAIKSLVFAPSFGLRCWLASGALLTRALYQLLTDIDSQPEAGEGMLPVLDWTGDRPRKVQKGPGAGRTYYVPKLERVGWMPRQPIFGERCNPVPVAPPQLTMLMGPGPGDVVKLPLGRGGKAERLIEDAIPFSAQVQ